MSSPESSGASTLLSPTEVAAAGESLSMLRAGLNQVLIDQGPVIEQVIRAVVARGHVLLEGLPGLGKTELCKGLARLLSLTVRLWVNMMVSEMLYGIFLGLTLALFLFAGSANVFGYALAPVPLVAPAIFIVLHIFVAFVQAFVFTILPVIYLAGAVSEGH